MSDRRGAVRGWPLLLACLFASGSAGLVYELVWTRQLSLILGSTAEAVAAVLISFMGGLSLGSYLAGRRLDARRERASRLYALLEIAIGLYALLSPLLLFTVQSLFSALAPTLGTTGVWLTATRFLLALGVLTVPTACMGATLPAAAAFAVPGRGRPRRTLAVLYGANTLGGALGALAAGYWLLPAVGLWITLLVAATVNLGIGLIMIRVGRKQVAFFHPPARPVFATAAPHPQTQPAAPGYRWVPVAAAVAGFCSLANEVLWFRSLHLAFGYSVYTFSALLAAFLTGVGSGGLASGRLRLRRETLLGMFGWCQLGLAAAGILLVSVLGWLPLWFPWLFEHGYRNFGMFQWVILGTVLLLLAAPTFLMGASLPLLARAHADRTHGPGQGLGSVIAANTAGAIAGSWAATFVLIPFWGTRTSLLVVSGVTLALGAVSLIPLPGKVGFARRWAPWVAMAAGGGWIWLLPPWNPSVQTAGFYSSNMVQLASAHRASLQDLLKESELLFYREGLTATVTVRRSRASGDLSLQVDGKTDASTGRDMLTQSMMGALPVLWHGPAEAVLVIGLGSGVTLASALEWEGAQVQCAEIEGAVIEAAAWFRDFNHDCLHHPRLDLWRADGRNVLLTGTAPYDVIISQPSNPWISGQSPLFTLEQFQAARRRLKPGGWMVQWFHFYTMSGEDFRTALRTFQAVFPRAHLWWIPQSGDVILIGAKDRELRYDASLLSLRLTGHEQLRRDLEAMGVQTRGELFALFALDDRALTAFAGHGPLHTDAHPVLEFSAPRALYDAAWLSRNETDLRRRLVSIVPHLDGLELEDPAQTLQTLEELGERYEQWESPAALSEVARLLREEFPERSSGYYYLSVCDTWAGRLAEADRHLARALTLKRHETAQRDAWQRAHRNQDVRSRTLALIQRFPRKWEPYYRLALTYAWEREYVKALGYFDLAVERGGKEPDLFYYRGLVRYFLNRNQAAQDDLRQTLALAPNHHRALLLLEAIGADDRAAPGPERNTP